MGPDDWAKLATVSPYLVAVITFGIYAMRKQAEEASAWREHERKELGELRDEVHRLMVIMVLHHSSLHKIDPDKDPVYQYVRENFQARVGGLQPAPVPS